ncbi:MAG TPA: FtsX-like permease family protein, partial [Longimicrobiales bacterium]|nr:FtsX-like permease family protein [Longimicrobiales bacterium]
EENARFDLALRSLQEMTVGTVRTDLGVLMAAVVLVLLVAALNVGGLLLARATARGGEVAVRMALGGGRGRLAWQLVTESAVLGAVGGVLGALLGRLGVAAMLTWAPAGTPRLDEVAMSGPALLFALGAAALSTLLFGAAPALQLLRAPALGLREGRGGGRAGARLRDGLVVIQVALALALLVGAGLLGKSFWRLARVHPGFDVEHVLVAGLPVVDAEFASMEERTDYLREIQDRAAGLPGVTAAGLTNAVPFVSSGPWFSYELPEVETDPEALLLVRYRVVTPGLFEALGVPIVRGRALTDEDARADAERVTVVSEAFVERHFPDGGPIGRLVRTSGETWRIVGVAADVLDGTLRQPSPAPHLYIALTPETRQTMTLLLRTTGDPDAMVTPLRSLVREISATQPVTHTRPLEAFLADSVGRPRFLVGLLVFFAGATILLAGVGLYGLLAFNVGRRTREIGVRVALGAPQRKVRTMVVGEGLRLAAAGLVLGLVLSLWGGGFLASLLFGVDARDPAILAGAAAGLFLVSAAAAWLPARRATAIRPQEALGVE